MCGVITRRTFFGLNTFLIVGTDLRVYECIYGIYYMHLQCKFYLVLLDFSVIEIPSNQIGSVPVEDLNFECLKNNCH